MKIDLHIERLVLEGLTLSCHERKRIVKSVTAELVRLLEQNGLDAALTEGGAIASVKSENIRLSSDVSAETTGRLIANSVYRGIGITKSGNFPVN